MPFREKSAWGSLVITLLAYGTYFTLLLPRLAANPSQPVPYLDLLLSCIVVMVVLQISVQATLAVLQADTANSPHDEREALIGLKSDRIAFIVLTVLINLLWLAYIVLPNQWASSAILANTILFALVASTAAKYASQILYFHRGL
jgi:hypothetical protein